MALLQRFHRKVPENLPGQIFIIGEIEDSVVSKAKNLELPITRLEIDIEDLKIVKFSLYVLHEFEENPFFEVLKNAQNIWILGPTSLEEIALTPGLEIRSRPTYSTSMYGLCFYVKCPKDKLLEKRVLQLIQWMGGLFVASPCENMTHMVTTTTNAHGTLYCSTFNVPMLIPEWVEECWKKRNSVGFKAKFIQNYYKLGPFAGLHICFKGYDFRYDELKLITEAHGGVVVTWDDPRCSHVIVNDNQTGLIEPGDIPSHILYVLNYKWFRSCVDEGVRNYEHLYKWQCASTPAETSVIEMDIIETNTSKYKRDDLNEKKTTDKETSSPKIS